MSESMVPSSRSEGKACCQSALFALLVGGGGQRLAVWPCVATERDRQGRKPFGAARGSASRLGAPVTRSRAPVSHLLRLLVGPFRSTAEEWVEQVPCGSEVSGFIWVVGSVLDSVCMASS